MKSCTAPAVIFTETWEDQVTPETKRRMLDFGDLPCDHRGELGMHCVYPRECPFVLADRVQVTTVGITEDSDG